MSKSRKASKSPGEISFRQVDAKTWRDFESLFEGPGAPKYCWCMAWRAVGHERNSRDSKSRRSFIKRRVMDGIPIGIIGYLGSKPATWCSIAPRPTYRPLGGIEDANEDPESVWSLVCFYVPRQLRGRGLAQRMISAAVEQARSRGASVVEAYPVDPGSPSYRFMGYVSSFRAAGFEEVGRAGTRRHVMRLRLNPPNRGRPG
ncbi:MAG: GNAT family N-acetyltransferase [Chloroflexi bacterium RBG_19FT_COMBO_62_14]|nr:MAG: GNAT family N-acetyltransferase [Chloroflexi bacterium RBG_19FT_COMBO_62_14]